MKINIGNVNKQTENVNKQTENVNKHWKCK